MRRRPISQTLRICALGISAILLCAGALSNCSKNVNEVTENEERINVIVSIIPQQYFIQAIGGDLVNVQAMVEKGASPATYEPKPVQIKAIEDADGYIAIGVPFENAWLEKFERANDNLQLFHQDQGVKKIDGDDHDHDEEEGAQTTTANNDDTGKDPHIWLSVKRAPKQAENIYNILSTLDPKNEATYKKNYDAFLEEISQLDEELTKIFSKTQQKEFLVYHPAFGYIADDYGLTQIPIEVEGKEPSAKELEGLITLAQEKQISTIFTENQFNTKSAETIARHIHGNVVTLDPLAENWSDNIKHIAQEIADQRSK